MKLVLYTLIIFFATLLAAGLVALGEPAETAVERPVTPTFMATTQPSDTPQR